MTTQNKLHSTDISSSEIPFKENCSTDELTNELIEGSPLWCVKNNEDGTLWTLAFGKYALKTGKSKQGLKEYVENNAMNVMTNIVICIMEENKNITNNEKKDDSL